VSGGRPRTATDHVTRFRISLDMLDEQLRERVLVLREFALGSAYSDIRTAIMELVDLAFAAAHAGDQAAAAACIIEAERFTEQRRLSLRSALRRGLGGRVKTPAARSGPFAATDGSYKKPWAGWGYVATNGHWGLGGGDFSGRLDPTGQQGALIMELRAVNMAVRDIAGPLTILIDSASAIRFLAAWRSGATSLMPDGYSLRERQHGSRPTLVALADLIRQRQAELTFEHVHGHAGHLLNEAADALARSALRHMARQGDGSAADAAARAEDLVASFLRSWRDAEAVKP
jgi:ribonuclease HI